MPVGTNNTTISESYSPLTLCQDVPKTGRLLFLVALSAVGTVMNGFFIASFFVERRLRKVGYVFHAFAGLADFIISGIILPTCSVVLLSGQWDNYPVCQIMHFLAILATYCYNVFFMMVAVESYNRICLGVGEYKPFTPAKVMFLIGIILIICLIAAVIGVFSDYDYNYCSRSHYGHFYFRLGTGIVFHVIPCCVTLFCLTSAYVNVKTRARKQIQYKRSLVFECDYSATALNIANYLLFVFAWTPYLIVVYFFPNSRDSYFYHFVWIGMGRSVISTFPYAFLNRNFRRAFSRLFNYCFCKNSLSTSLAGRHRRTLVRKYRTPGRSIKVHILQEPITSPPRFSPIRVTQEI